MPLPPRSTNAAARRRLLAGCCLATLALAQPAAAQQPTPSSDPGRGTERSMRVQPPGWMQSLPFGQPASARQPRAIVPPPDETRFVPDEVLFELAPDAQADAVLRRYGATLITSRRVE